jgi:hypothetical protein
MSEPEPPENGDNRAVENVVMLGFFIVLWWPQVSGCSGRWPICARHRIVQRRADAIAER